MIDAETIGRRYTWLIQEPNDPPMVGQYNLWLSPYGSCWCGTFANRKSSIDDAAITDRKPHKYATMIWPLFLAYVDSHRRAWNQGGDYLLAISKTGAVQIWGNDSLRLLHEWPNLHSACSWLETWKNGAAL